MTIALDRRFTYLQRDLAHKTRDEQISAYQALIRAAESSPTQWDTAPTITRSQRAIVALDYPVPGCAPDKPLITNNERAYLGEENCQTLAITRWMALRKLNTPNGKLRKD